MQMNTETIKMYANLASYAYNDHLMVSPPEGYDVIYSTPHLTDNGFQGVIYGKKSSQKDDGKYDEIVVAYRGSMPPNNFNLNEFIQDWFINDFGDIVGGQQPAQFQSALDLYDLAKDCVSAGGSIVLTGHSLGGALVQLVAAKEGVEGYTFNAPGVKLQADQAGYTSDNVHNYIIMNDIIGNLRDSETNSSSSGHVGEEYYYFPTETGSTVGMFDPHGAYTQIDDFSAYVTDVNWTFEKSLALFWFDASNSLDKISIVEKIFLYKEAELDKSGIGLIPNFNVPENAINLIEGEIASIVAINGSKLPLSTKLGFDALISLYNLLPNSYFVQLTDYLKDNVLKESIDDLNKILNNNTKEWNENKNVLSYVTNEGMYVIGTGDNIGSGVIQNIGIDYLEGSNKDDIIWGRGNEDTIVGKAGNNVLIGDYSTHTVSELEFLRDNPLLVVESDFEHEDDGNDTIHGGINGDLIIGGGGNDVIYGNGGSNVIYGGSGDDRIYGSGSIGLVTDSNIIYGGVGNDTLVAGYGSSSLYGAEENDILVNYKGSAYLEGLSGYDTYNISRSSGNVLRDDFDGEGCVNLDSLTLNGAIARFYEGNNTWYRNDINVRYVLSDNSLRINDNTIILDFKNGDLGIFLEYPTPEPEPTDTPPNETDPIIFDLNGDGIQTTTTPYQGVKYDYNNDGFAERIAWAAKDDGVLVVDANNDGVIQGSSDIILSSTLAEYDTNTDGVVDANDENFNNLKIMKVDGSVLSMEEAGIASIDITNIHYQRSAFVP